MMEGWKTVQLTKCIERTAIPVKIPRKQFQESGQFPIVSQERELVNGYWSDESAVIRVDSPLVVFGDHTQVLKYIDFDFVVGADGTKLLRPKSFLNAKYFYYFLMANPIDALGYARHYRMLKELDIKFPELLNHQKRIVAILDEAFAGIATAVANAEKNLANARELFENHLNAVFNRKGDGWLEKKFEDICTLQRGFDLPKRLRENGKHPILSSSGQIDTHSESRVAGPGVAVGRSGSVGSVFFIEEDYWPLNTVLYVKDFHRNDPEFVYWFLKQFDLRDYAGGTGVPTLNRNHVHSVLVTVPSDISEQKKVAASINKMLFHTNSAETVYEIKLDSLAELKQSILQKAFSGELTKVPDRALAEACV
jgi:type I restriction enzyme S subunit